MPPKLEDKSLSDKTQPRDYWWELPYSLELTSSMGTVDYSNPSSDSESDTSESDIALRSQSESVGMAAEEVPAWLQQLLEAQTKSQENLIKALTTRTKQHEDCIDKDRLIDRFPAMKESDGLELYLQSFENEMTQLEVNPDRWKALITVRLTPKMKGYICDIQQNP